MKAVCAGRVGGVTLRVAMAMSILGLAGGRRAPAKAPEIERVGAMAMEITNGFRKEQGLEPVVVNEKLMATAKEFAEFMARTGKYGHEADGRTPADRAKAKGYGYALVLENIAWASDSRGFGTEQLAKKFAEGWKNSPAHWRNMIDEDVTETAVAVAKGADDAENGAKYYAVQMFGRPASQMVRFKVENRTGKAVSYVLTSGGEEKSYDLPPRMTREHYFGRSVKVKVEGGEEVKAKVGDFFWVRGGEGGTVVLERRERK